MPLIGKCSNFGGCLLASCKQEIVIADGAPFVCPECTFPLLRAGRKPLAIQAFIVGGLVILTVMAVGAVYIRARSLKEALPSSQIGTSFEQAEVAASHEQYLPSRHLPNSISLGSVQSLLSGLNLQNGETQLVKADVLRRLDSLPDPAAADQSKLLALIAGARQMGRIATIPFPPGHVALSPVDVDQLRAIVQSSPLHPLLKDANPMLLVLGFANINGDQQASLHLSTERATSVLNTLRDRCGLTNAMYAVGMGASNLFGSEKDAARDRLVEIWALLP